MKNEKLVFQKPEPKRYRDLKVDKKTHDRIRAMSEKAGVTMIQVVRQMVDFCESRI